MNHDLVDKPPDQLFVIFLDDGRLFPEEGAHIGDPLAQVIPAGVFNLSLLLFIAQTENTGKREPSARSFRATSTVS